MILENVREAGEELLKKNGIKITISVPKGKELATKTDNPRIGIMGGISILGTSGIVIPYSTASFAAAIRQQIAVVSSMNDDYVVLTTGGRSEDFAREIIELPDHSFIQMGDLLGNKGKRVEVDVSKMRFGQATNIKKEVNIFEILFTFFQLWENKN